ENSACIQTTFRPPARHAPANSQRAESPRDGPVRRAGPPAVLARTDQRGDARRVLKRLAAASASNSTALCRAPSAPPLPSRRRPDGVDRGQRAPHARLVPHPAPHTIV